MHLSQRNFTHIHLNILVHFLYRDFITQLFRWLEAPTSSTKVFQCINADETLKLIVNNITHGMHTWLLLLSITCGL